MKQILILNELGLSKESITDLAKQAGIEANLVFDTDDLVNPASVTGIITVTSPVTAEVLSSYPNAQFIAVAFTGYDSVDMSYCKENDIAVMNVPSYSTTSVAELTLGLAISLLRDIPKGHNTVHAGKWALPPGQELAGKTIGIVGTGAIGTQVAKYFKTLGCNIIGWSRTEQEVFKTYGTYIPKLVDLFAKADIVSLHLPLNKKTKHIIGAKELKMMKEKSYLINTARGGVIDEEVLIELLANGNIAGAALDVYNSEPLPESSKLRNLDNVILMPHIAYKTAEALERRALTTMQNIADLASGKNTNRVDL